MNPLNILITGSGGQGVVFTGELLSQIFLSVGLTPNATLNHGFSQRGGYVLFFLRLCDREVTPLIEEGTCDYFLHINPLDDQRYHQYCHKGTQILSFPADKVSLLASEQTQNIALIGMLLKNLKIIKNQETLTFPMEKVADLLKANMKKNLNDNLKALEIGYHV